MPSQLRVFRIARGQARRFADEWRATVLPLREQLGFRVTAAFVAEADDLFVWLLEHDGDFEAADAAYYESAERAALDPDPRRLIEEVVLAAFVEAEPFRRA